MHRLHSNSFSDLAPYVLSAPSSNFPAKVEESSRFLSVGCCPDVFVWRQENKNISSISQRDVSLLNQILVSRNELRGIENTGARDVNFLLQVREFLFLICVKNTISIKTLVLRVINSSLLIEIALYEVIITRRLCQKHTHSYLARSVSHSCIQPRTRHFL